MRYRKYPVIISILLLVFIIGFYFLVPSFNGAINEAFSVLTSGDETEIENWVSKFGIWGPLVIVLAMVASMFLFVVPNLLLLIISSVSYGPLWGSIISFIAVFISSSIAYMIGYSIGPVILRRLLKDKVRVKLTELVSDYGVGAIILFRLSPVLSNEAISFIPAFLRMRYKRFILATLAGSAPIIGILAFSVGGDNFKPVLIWLSILSIAVYLLYLYMDIRRKRRRSMT